MRVGIQILVVLGVLFAAAKVAAAQEQSLISAATQVAAATDGVVVGPARRYVYRPVVPGWYGNYTYPSYRTYRAYDYWYEPPRYYDSYRGLPYPVQYDYPWYYEYYGPRRSIIIGY